MAISSTPSLLEIEAEFGGSGLVACANNAGLSLPVGMMQFAGLSNELIITDGPTAYVPYTTHEFWHSYCTLVKAIGPGSTSFYWDFESKYDKYTKGIMSFDLNGYNLGGFSNLRITWRNYFVSGYGTGSMDIYVGATNTSGTPSWDIVLDDYSSLNQPGDTDSGWVTTVIPVSNFDAGLRYLNVGIEYHNTHSYGATHRMLFYDIKLN